MRKIEVENSAAERLELHAERRGVDLGVMIHFALNALETAEAQPGAQAASPKNHSGASVTYGGGAGTPAGGRAGDRGEGPGGTDRAYPRDGAPGARGEPRRFRVRTQGGSAQDQVIDPENPGRVTHSRIREAKVDGRPIDSPSWNGLVAELVIRALDASIDLGEVKKLSKSIVVRGWTDEAGFSSTIPEGTFRCSADKPMWRAGRSWRSPSVWAWNWTSDSSGCQSRRHATRARKAGCGSERHRRGAVDCQDGSRVTPRPQSGSCPKGTGHILSIRSSRAFSSIPGFSRNSSTPSSRGYSRRRSFLRWKCPEPPPGRSSRISASLLSHVLPACRRPIIGSLHGPHGHVFRLV